MTDARPVWVWREGIPLLTDWDNLMPGDIVWRGEGAPRGDPPSPMTEERLLDMFDDVAAWRSGGSTKS